MTDIVERLRELEQDAAAIKADIAELRVIVGYLKDWRLAEHRAAELSGRRMFGEFPGYRKPTNTAE